MRKYSKWIISGAILAAFLISMPGAGAQPKSDNLAEDQIAEALPEHLLYLYSSQAAGPDDAPRQLSTTTWRWQSGDTLKVCFFGGNEVSNTLVAAVASEWNRYSTVKFDFGPSGKWRDCNDPRQGYSQIKVGYGSAGYWSAIGRSSTSDLNSAQPSMNFERFDLRYSPNQMAQNGQRYTPANIVGLALPYHIGTILHEFGHALGLMHEHQNSSLNCYDEIKWQGSGNAFDYYAGPPNYWNAKKVEYNVGKLQLTSAEYDSGAPDPKSIMMYAQPAAIFKNGANSKCYVQPNNVLSPLDKAYIARIYPAVAAPVNDTADTQSTLPAVSSQVAASTAGQEDALTRANVDLLSDNTSIRREARNQLAALITVSGDTRLAGRLLKEAQGKSYRRMLGVTTAISRAKISFSNAPADRATALAELDAIERDNQTRIKDSSLAQAIAGARKALL